MRNRESFHIYKLFEEYSKKYLSFDYSPKFYLDKNYYLKLNDVKNILKDNARLIKAMYDGDEATIGEIVKKKDILVDNFEGAQIDGNQSKKKLNITPLPIQARYVLKGWNNLRINDLNRENLISIFSKKAFDKSPFPQLTKMGLAFEKEDFKDVALNTLECLITEDQYSLFYSLLAYYYRINQNTAIKDTCLTLSKLYENKLQVDEKLITNIKIELNS